MRVPIGLSAMDAAGTPLPTVDGTSLHPETPSDRRLRGQPMPDSALPDGRVQNRAGFEGSSAEARLADRAVADKAPADRAPADRAVADRAVADRGGTDRGGTDGAVADRAGGDWAATGRSGAGRSGAAPGRRWSDVQLLDLRWSDDRSSSPRPPSEADTYRGGRQWSDRDPSDPVLDNSAGHRATLLGVRHGSPAALRRKARETAQQAPSAAPARDDSDPTPLFTSTRFTSTPTPDPWIADRHGDHLESTDQPAPDPAAYRSAQAAVRASGRRERELAGTTVDAQPVGSLPPAPDLHGVGADEAGRAGSAVDGAGVAGARPRSRRSPGSDPAGGRSRTDGSFVAKRRSSVDGGRHAAANTGRHSSP
jgi:hypothetical protein